MTRLILFLTLLLVTFACSKTETSTPTPVTPVQQKVVSVSLKNISTNTFWIGESDAITLSAELKDDKGTIITNYSGKVSYFANGTELTNNTFNPTAEGNYDLKAQVENINSANSVTITAKSPQKEIDKIVMTSGFYQKYAVWHTMTGTKPELSVKGYDKNGSEIPIQKGLKASINTTETSLNNLIFEKVGTHKIMASAYGKQTDMTFVVRSPRTFEVVRLPIVFHFCQPGTYKYPNSAETDSTMYKKAIEALKNNTYLDALNRAFRNQYLTDISKDDPNAQDTYIEFYLAETDPDGKILPMKGVNILDYSRPFQAQTTYDYNTPEARKFFGNINTLLKKWDSNKYINVILQNYGTNYGVAGSASTSSLNSELKSSLPQGFFDLPYSQLTDKNNPNRFVVFENPNTYQHNIVNITGFSLFTDMNIFLLQHELGHTLGLWHTFRLGCSGFDTDGLWDTPMVQNETSTISCTTNIPFAQRNIMSYLGSSRKLYFTYDQVTIMRAFIEAGFNLPTPRNKSKSGGRVGVNDNTRYFGQPNVINCNVLH